jgi:hypothetical protein
VRPSLTGPVQNHHHLSGRKEKEKGNPQPHPFDPHPERRLLLPLTSSHLSRRAEEKKPEAEKENSSPPSLTATATATPTTTPAPTMSARAPAPTLRPEERADLLSLLAAAARPLADVVADFLARFPRERRLRVGGALSFLLEASHCPSPSLLTPHPPSSLALLRFFRLGGGALAPGNGSGTSFSWLG